MPQSTWAFDKDCTTETPDFNPTEHLSDVMEQEIHIMDMQLRKLQRICEAVI